MSASDTTNAGFNADTTGSRHPLLYLAWAMLGGLLIAVPVGWLLSVLLRLPAFLGLFFCLLLGLLLGAAVYRLARPAAPIRRPWLILTATVLSLATWGITLAGEYANVRGYAIYRYGAQGFDWYPVDGDVTQIVRRSFSYRSFVPGDLQEMRRATIQAFLDHLAEKHPPGGFVGFLKWATFDGHVDLPRVFKDSTEPLDLRTRGIAWIIRQILALLFIGGTILSQVLNLAPQPRSTPNHGP